MEAITPFKPNQPPANPESYPLFLRNELEKIRRTLDSIQRAVEELQAASP